jgi:aerobic carbon-monoxide dehydrogenase small subunit
MLPVRRRRREPLMRAIGKAVDSTEVSLTVNGAQVNATVPVRRLLVDFIRDDLGLTGTRAGCEHGVCGACTILIDGAPVRSCIMLAPQADGSSITTVEGITPADGLGALQQAFKDHHALQCGFCTPGFLMTITAADPADHPDDRRIREMLSGNLCRCTGYQNIVHAVKAWWGRDHDD